MYGQKIKQQDGKSYSYNYGTTEIGTSKFPTAESLYEKPLEMDPIIIGTNSAQLLTCYGKSCMILQTI
jgi:hypothetical protein